MILLLQKYLVIIFGILFVFSLAAQTKRFRFEHITTDNGLSSNNISHIFQDKKGFLWISTQDGINRYDGNNFKQFRHIPGNTNSLSDYAAHHILEDSKGLFWIATRDGLNLFDPAIEKFTHFKPIKGDSNSISSEKIVQTAEDKFGKIWVATRNGLNIYDPLNKTFKVFLNNPLDKKSLTNNYVNALFKDRNGNLWIGTDKGLNKFNYEKNDFDLYPNDSQNPKSIAGNRITCFFEDIHGNMWIGTTSGLSKLISISEDTIEFENYQNNPSDKNSLSTNSIAVIDEDRKGNLWIGTFGGGINIFNPLTNKFINIKHSSDDINSLSDDNIFVLHIDTFDNVWIGTPSNGLNKYSQTKDRFLIFQPNPLARTEIESNNISSIYIDNQKHLWIGTAGDGIKVYQSNTLVDHSNLLFEFRYDSKNNNSLSSNNVTSIIQDKDGFFWIGTFGGGLNKYDARTKKFEVFKYNRENPNTPGNDYIHTIFEDTEGIIWIGTGMGGLNRFDKITKSFKRFRENPNYPDDPRYLNSREVTSIYEDDNGYLWIGTTTGGLSRFDRKSEMFTHFKHIQEDEKSISSNRIVCFYKDVRGGLWIGTFSGGLNLYNANTNSFTHFLEKDGLSANTVQSISGDDAGNLWLATTNGISKFNPDNKVFKNYDVNDGLQGKEFNPNATYKDVVSGAFYFGGRNGLNIWYPNLINEINALPVIVITDFKVFNQSVSFEDNSSLTRSMTFAKEINLPFDQNVISFEFAALDFTSPEKNQYAYMLEGFDKNWIYCGNKREVTYTNLNIGNYVFKVKGSNSDGVWNEAGLLVNIVIQPPFWKTWWAYLIYFLIAAAGFFAVRKYELNRVKLKNELKLKEFESQKLLEVDQIKSRFFANISHEFRTPLTIILGSLEKLKSKMEKNTNEKEFHLMKRNASRLLQLINQLLELSKIETGNVKLSVSQSDLVKFLKRIIASFSSLAYQKHQRLLFNGVNIESTASNEIIMVYFDKKKLETVFYNLLANAVKFTPENGTINISIDIEREYTKVKVANSGIEIPPEKLSRIFDRFYQVDDSGTRDFEGTGIGLSLVKEYVELHKGKIEVESNNNQTSFTIYLRCGDSHLMKDEFSGEESMDTNLPYIQTPNELPDSVAFRKQETEPVESEKTIILVVEDNQDLREMIKENLNDKFSVLEAENGLKGLKIAEEIIPDLIISDIMMPEMDGFELARKIKMNEKTNHIPVILLTAKAAADDKLEGLETGADDYLIKPFNEKELNLRVRNLIKIRQQMREKYQSQMLVKPGEIIVPSTQKVFLDKLTSIIERNISNEIFSVELLCEEIAMSRAQLHRKIKALTNQSASEFIRNFRLQRAADLLKQDAGNIAEISYMVGFGSQAYFTKMFQEVYGQTPLEYKKQLSK